MQNVNVFDVVELKNKEKAVVLNVTEQKCLVDVEGAEKRQQLIDREDVVNVLIRH